MLGKLADWTYKPFLAYPDKTERLVYLLIFLFPIAGMSVTSWLSSIFNFLVLISLFMLRKTREPLLKEEKVFLWICAAYFSMFIISALINGWGQSQTHELGTETRFLLAIPLYLLVRRYPDCIRWLLTGAVLGGFCLFAQAYYDVFVCGQGTATGLYSKNILGPFAVLTAFWCFHFFWHNRVQFRIAISIMIIISIIAALITAGLSGSRGGYIGFVITGVFCIMFYSRPRWMFAGVGLMLLTVFLLYKNISIVENRIDLSVSETVEYFQAENHVTDESSRSSTGTHLEMLRTGVLFIMDAPVIGIGPGNYLEHAKKYVNEGKASPSIAEHHYPHNTFFQVATAKGLLGLITVFLLFYYPAFVYIKTYKVCKSTAVLGLVHIVALSSFSLSDHSVVLYNNYTSILLLGVVLFLSSHIRTCKKILANG